METKSAKTHNISIRAFHKTYVVSFKFSKKLNSAPFSANILYEDLVIKMNKVINILDILNTKLDQIQRNLTKIKKACSIINCLQLSYLENFLFLWISDIENLSSVCISILLVSNYLQISLLICRVVRTHNLTTTKWTGIKSSKFPHLYLFFTVWTLFPSYLSLVEKRREHLSLHAIFWWPQDFKLFITTSKETN